MKLWMMLMLLHQEITQVVTVVTEVFPCQPSVQLAHTAHLVRNMKPTICAHLVPTAIIPGYRLIPSVHLVTQEVIVREKVNYENNLINNIV